MRRLWPSSLLGQVLASAALALLVAQIISAALLYGASEQRRESALLATAAFQLVGGAERAARNEAMRQESARLRRPPGGSGRGLPRVLRYSVTSASPFASDPGTIDGDAAVELRGLLLRQGIDPARAVVGEKRAGEDPAITQLVQRRPRLARRTEWRRRPVLIAAIQREPGGVWETARVLHPERRGAGIGALVFQTIVIFVFLMAILFLLLRRITGPLARLTTRVDDFSRRPEQAVRLAESGPADVKRLIAAHNTMEARIAALLDEKDVMLGAIGHDLKTPLAALRVRIESVADDAQRARMAETIEDIAATLDDILSLARIGKGDQGEGDRREAVDLSALAAGIVEEFEDLGEDVALIEGSRVVAQVHVTWLKRALRNLVSNAVRYGGSARVSVLSAADAVILRVEDEGPGIAQDRIAEMTEPFTRGEASRNRATGGAGLGLALTCAIAEQHGGELALDNRSTGGLRAEIRLPIQS